ncbi:MAG: hypothetical protein J6B15_04665 [Muribaculaceae bacterium]|nr:hypothetical protein [Muribaculaceae bacterium]
MKYYLLSREANPKIIGNDFPLGDVMMDNQPDYSTSYRYDLNGNPTKVSRYGMSEQ